MVVVVRWTGRSRHLQLLLGGPEVLLGQIIDTTLASSGSTWLSDSSPLRKHPYQINQIRALYCFLLAWKIIVDNCFPSKWKQRHTQLFFFWFSMLSSHSTLMVMHSSGKDYTGSLTPLIQLVIKVNQWAYIMPLFHPTSDFRRRLIGISSCVCYVYMHLLFFFCFLVFINQNKGSNVF